MAGGTSDIGTAFDHLAHSSMLLETTSSLQLGTSDFGAAASDVTAPCDTVM